MGNRYIRSIYLASALSNAELNRRIAEAMSLSDLSCYLPQDDPLNHSDVIDGNAIARQNREQIQSCDALVAVVSRMGLDTSWEIGFACGLKKPCVLLCTASSLDQARESAMPFYSVSEVCCLPSWDESTTDLANHISDAIHKLATTKLSNNCVNRSGESGRI